MGSLSRNLSPGSKCELLALGTAARLTTGAFAKDFTEGQDGCWGKYTDQSDHLAHAQYTRFGNSSGGNVVIPGDDFALLMSPSRVAQDTGACHGTGGRGFANYQLNSQGAGWKFLMWAPQRLFTREQQ